LPDYNSSRLDHENVLKILKAIKANPEITQRELSSVLGISLGKINFFLRALVEKGFVKVDNFKKSNNKNAYLYYLTPRGMEAKAKTTYLYLKRKMAEYERLEEEIRELQKDFAGMTAQGEQLEERDIRS
jgi:EPS-associated MarR family transcriptional regulator